MPAEAVRRKGAGTANYAADWVMDVLDDFVGAVDTDIVVTTTIEPALQGAAERALVDELAAKGAALQCRPGRGRGDDAGRRREGPRRRQELRREPVQPRRPTAQRQPGSAFKPFVYLAAIERGLTPDTVRDDAPVVDPRLERRRTTRATTAGPVTLRDALALSLNTVAVRLGDRGRPARRVVQTAQRLGISSPLQANASIALGTSEVTPLELVGAYAPFANGGARRHPLRHRRRRRPATGRVLYERQAGRARPGRRARRGRGR